MAAFPERFLAPPRAFRVLTFVLVMCVALTLGLTLAHVLEIPGQQTLSGPAWLQVQHTFYGGFEIVGAPSEILGLSVAIALAVWAGRRRALIWPYAVAALCFVGTLLAYWIGNRPVNAMVISWTPATLPANWTTYRSHWGHAHAVSCVFAALAFLSLVGHLVHRHSE